MIQELSNKVWSNPAFHAAMQRMELAWLTQELGLAADRPLDTEAGKIMQAAAILACSENQMHRLAAFRIATCAYEVAGVTNLPLDQALRVTLSRLGNYPSMSTRRDVDSALQSLPLVLAAEELSSAEGREISINDRSIYFTDFQHLLWNSLIGGARVSLSAPTSAGKSFVLQTYLSSRFATNPVLNVVAYVVPTRALIAQVSGDLEAQFKTFGKAGPDIVTVPTEADEELSDSAIYVMTQERIQLMLNAHPEFRVDTLIIDEAQSIADGARGVLLHWVIDDLIARNPATQVLFASPTIRNLDVFGRLFGLDDIVEFPSIEPTVAQNFLVVTVESATKGQIAIYTAGDGSRNLARVAGLQLDQTIASRIDKLVHVPLALGRGHSNIIYANGAADAESIAIQLAEMLSEQAPTEHQLALADLAKEAVHPLYALAECVKRGVAFHYSNIPTQLRRAVEMAAMSGEIKYLVCTSTLLQGVNLPAKNIFMCLPEKGRGRPLESTDFWNLSGRAGRLKREFQGNIFLIDYGKWKSKPLEGPKDSVVLSALQSTVEDHRETLEGIISGSPADGGDNDAAETTFGRLYFDLKSGALSTTLRRIGVSPDSPSALSLSLALNAADERLTLPPEIFRQTPSVSAHKQQRIFEELRMQVNAGTDAAVALVPLHPREAEAFQSYADVLERCYRIVLNIDTSRNLHRFHALLATWWMKGLPLPQIIENQITRNPKTSARTNIRQALELVESQIRFQAVRLFGCYNTLLAYTLHSAGMEELVSRIPALPIYLELGASDRTMISFMSLGLSRVAAMRLNEVSARKDLDVAGAREWLRSRPLETLGLSPLLLAEVQAIADS
jgi:hypothetical protein